MLPSILVNNKRAYTQVKQEALVSLKLVHSNIVAVRAFEEADGNPFLVMDYIDGQTLDDYLAEKGKLSEDETVKLLKPVAAALDYAHAQGVVHRDVKPGNVMIRRDGTPFVLDFGIAREIQETMTRVTGKLSSGTVLYMSPEQLHGAAPKPVQDVYSFAAMAYECLTGTPPFSRGQIEYQIEHDTPEPLGPHFKCGPGVMAGLAKLPEERPTTCSKALSSEMKNCKPKVLNQQPKILGEGKGGSGKARVTALLLGILVLVGVGGWWMWHEMQRRDAIAVERERLIEMARREAERQKAEAERLREDAKRMIEERREAERQKTAVTDRTDDNADKHRQEEFAKLATMRTKIAIKISAAKGDYEKVAPYRTEKDGFEAHLSEIDRQWAMIDGVRESKTLAEAEKTFESVTEAADTIAFELNWLQTNRDGRDAAKRIEKEIADELEAKLREFKADDVAKSKYEKGQRERREAAATLKRGEFASARRQYETAKATLSTALAEARQFQIKTTLSVANEYMAAAQWQNCLSEAEKVLGWDPQNADAQAIKKDAEAALEPTVYLTASLDGVPQTATFLSGIDRTGATTPMMVNLKSIAGQKWSCRLRYVADGITYEGEGSCVATPGRQSLDVKLRPAVPLFDRPTDMNFCRHCRASLLSYAKIPQNCPKCGRNLFAQVGTKPTKNLATTYTPRTDSKSSDSGVWGEIIGGVLRGIAAGL